MKIVRASVELLNCSHPFPLKVIEAIARTCYKSEAQITEDSAERFVRTLIARGHNAMLEHVNYTFKVICDRGVSHEIVRHRIASYAQESTRYCNYSADKYGNEVTFVEPFFYIDHPKHYKLWEKAMEDAEQYYLTLLKSGSTCEQARSILPNSLKTEIIITMNVSALRNFFTLRTAQTAHPQMREVANLMLNKVQKHTTILFDDIKKKEGEANGK